MPNRVGQQFGNYQLARLLGEGGFAEVYLGEHIHLGTQAAIKVLHTQLVSNDVDKFRAEARMIARLIHPHIVRVLEFGMEGKTPFLVMDYAPHGTLRQRSPKGVALPLSFVIDYAEQAASALQYAHDEKLIHRDVKPENMLFGRRNEILLSDFGIALVAQSSRYQSAQEMAGTMAYIAPEQILGNPRQASDQYSLGIIVYEWLTGDRPFHGSLTELVGQHLAVPPPSLQEKVSTISPEVDRIVQTALAKDPKQRFESVQAFANALRDAAHHSPSTATANTPPIESLMGASTILPERASQPPLNFQPEVLKPHLMETQFEMAALSHSESHLLLPPQPVAFPEQSFLTTERAPSSKPSPEAPTNPSVLQTAQVKPHLSEQPGSQKHHPPRQHHGHRTHHMQHTGVSVTKAAGVKTVMVVVGAIVVAAGGIGAAALFLSRPQPLIRITSKYQVGHTPAGTVGTILHISGQNFSSNSPITFLLDGHAAPSNSGMRSDSKGTFSADVTITDAWSVGTYTLTARDASNDSPKNSVSVTIVQPGQANTPGPNSAPPDDASFTLNITLQGANLFGGAGEPFTSNPVLIITGHSGPSGGSVCSPDDNGQSFTQNSTASNNGIPYTLVGTGTCSGTYKAGQLNYVETDTSATASFDTSTCVLNHSTVVLQLTGAYIGHDTFSGMVNEPDVSFACDHLGAAYEQYTARGTWTGTIVKGP